MKKNLHSSYQIVQDFYDLKPPQIQHNLLFSVFAYMLQNRCKYQEEIKIQRIRK